MQIDIIRYNAIDINRINGSNTTQVCKAANKACQFRQLIW